MAAVNAITRRSTALVLPAATKVFRPAPECSFSLFVPGGVTVKVDKTGLPGDVADLGVAGHWESTGADVVGPKMVSFDRDAPVTGLRLECTAGGTVYVVA